MPAPSCHCSESDYKCAPVRVASSQVDPPATFADRALAPSHTKGSRNRRSENCLRHRSSAPRHSRRLCAATGSLPLPFVDGRNLSLQPPTPTCVQALVRPDTLVPANCPRRRAIALKHCRRLCAATGTQPRHEGLRHQEVLGSAPHRFSRATTGEGRVRLVREYVVACLRVHHRNGLPVAHSVSGTKHGRTFREIDGRTSITPALTSCRAPGLLMVRRLFLAMLLRKVSGERNTVPERIPRSVSGSRTRASSG